MAIFTETFNKADGAGLGPDLPWTDIVAGMRTVTNRATNTTQVVNALASMSTDLGTPDMTIEGELVDFGNTNYFDIQLIARFVDVNNYIAFMRGFRTGNNYFYNLRKVVAGVTTEAYTTGPAFVSGEILRGEAIGNTARLFLNDVELTSLDITGMTGQQAALGAFRSNTASTRNMFVNTLTINTDVVPPTPPPVPTGLVAVAAAGPSVDVSWNASIGATDYDLQRETWFGEGAP